MDRAENGKIRWQAKENTMNEPRVYRHSPILFVILVLVFGLLGAGIFTTFLQEDFFLLIPFGSIFLLILGISLFSATSKTIISDTEITSQNLLGTKTLLWSEIHSVSGKGYGIKLHNFAGDITVSPSSSLPGYEEVIEEIGRRRSDLFHPQEHEEMTRSWPSRFILPFIALLFLGVGLFLFIQEVEDGVSLLIFLSLIAAVLLFSAFASPQSISIEGRSLALKYAFSQKTLTAEEMRSIALLYYRTRNGKRYFIQLDLVNGKTVKVSGMNPSLPIVYLTLKNWHGKYSGNGLTKRPYQTQI